MSGETKRDEKRYRLGPGGDLYMTTVEHLSERGPTGALRRGHLLRSTDGGESWREIPLRLSWRHWHYTFATHWPPALIDEVEMTGGALSIVFHDAEDFWEKSILPFGWGDDSIWRARLLTSGRWRLERIRRIDWDGVDQNLRRVR